LKKCLKHSCIALKGQMKKMCEPITFTIEDDDGEEITYLLPTKYEVCDRCRGTGRHVNPNIEPYGGGFTYSEWQEACYEDPDFAEDYFSGVYDVICSECKGLRVVPVVNEDVLDEKQQETYKIYLEMQRDAAYTAAEMAAERRMGA